LEQVPVELANKTVSMAWAMLRNDSLPVSRSSWLSGKPTNLLLCLRDKDYKTEPAGLAVLGFGVAGTGFTRRRKKPDQLETCRTRMMRIIKCAALPCLAAHDRLAAMGLTRRRILSIDTHTD